MVNNKVFGELHRAEWGEVTLEEASRLYLKCSRWGGLGLDLCDHVGEFQVYIL
jgi:hypothetical protein